MIEFASDAQTRIAGGGRGGVYRNNGPAGLGGGVVAMVVLFGSGVPGEVVSGGWTNITLGWAWRSLSASTSRSASAAGT